MFGFLCAVCAALSSSACASMTFLASFMHTLGGIALTFTDSARGSDLFGMLPVSDKALANLSRGSVNNASKTSGTSAGGFIWRGAVGTRAGVAGVGIRGSARSGYGVGSVRCV